MNNLTGPCWQQCPVKPASFPRPHALQSLEDEICPVFSPFSVLGTPAPLRQCPCHSSRWWRGEASQHQKAWQMLSLTLA